MITKSIEPSKFQKAILDWPTLRGGNLVVNALAGSGKTKTLELLCNSPGLNGLDTTAVSFNKSIAEELGRRLPFWCKSSTMHSLGFGIIKRELGWVKVNDQKLDNILKFEVYDFKSCTKEEKKEAYGIRHFVLKMCGLLKSHLHLGPNLPGDIIDRALNYGLDLPKDIAKASEILQKVWSLGLKKTKVIDFDDMIYLPVAMDMSIPKSKWALIDEVQDLNPTQIELASRLGDRIICVGDVNQAIYGFRGADANAMQRLIETLDADQLPLSICYRCSKAVIKEAQKLVPQIEHSDTAVQGTVTAVGFDDFKPLDSDFVLCRTVAPLVQHCLRLISKGQRATILGRDIGEGLVAFVEMLDAKDVQSLLVELDDYEINETSKLQARNRDQQVVELQDKCSVIRALCEDCLSITHLVSKINSLFSTEAGAGVTFSTIHKSKGLEADHVWILHPELLPHPRVKVEWMIQQEMNLKYVAITRARVSLTWVG